MRNTQKKHKLKESTCMILNTKEVGERSGQLKKNWYDISATDCGKKTYAFDNWWDCQWVISAIKRSKVIRKSYN